MNRRTAKGQALVLFLGFAAAMIGILLVSFNSGQVSNAKMRAMNAADAAAYSGAVWQARTLNFQAYMNRAMVVNEVTIAQSVSLRSWIDYLAKFISNVNQVARFIPYVGTATTAISRGLDQVDEAVQRLMPRFEQAARVLSYAEAQAQEGFNAFGVLGATDIAYDVAKKNGADVSLGGKALFVLKESRWRDFTKTYKKDIRPSGTSGDGRARLRAVTLDSRDGFTQDRKWELGFALIAEGKLNKQGGTDLVNYDAWKGLDSAAMCTGVLKCRPWVELGWGGAQAYSTRSPVTGIGPHGSGDWNRVDGRRARVQANSRGQATALSNVFPDYRDLQDLDPKRTDRQKIAFAIEVLVKDGDVPTANSAFRAKAAVMDGRTVEHDPQYGGSEKGVYGLAEGCVSFDRPEGLKRQDGGVERPSLFNPYWRASLATPSAKTRVTVGITKQLAPVEAFVGGDGSCS
jgi:hypothetical protein